MPTDASASGQFELVGIALVEGDDALIVTEARDGGELAFVGEAVRNSPWRPSATPVCAGALSRKPAKPAERLFVLVDRQRDRRGTAPDRLVRLGIRNQFVEVALDEARVDVARDELGWSSAEQEAGVGADRPDLDLVAGARPARRSPASRSSPRTISLAIIGS